MFPVVNALCVFDSKKTDSVMFGEAAESLWIPPKSTSVSWQRAEHTAREKLCVRPTRAGSWGAPTPPILPAEGQPLHRHPPQRPSQRQLPPWGPWPGPSQTRGELQARVPRGTAHCPLDLDALTATPGGTFHQEIKSVVIRAQKKAQPLVTIAEVPQFRNRPRSLTPAPHRGWMDRWPGAKQSRGKESQQSPTKPLQVWPRG